MINTRLEGLIGFALRSRTVVVGEKLLEMLGKRRVSLVLIASDASARSRKELDAALNNAKLIEVEQDQTSLGLLINQRPVNAVGFTDSHLASAILAEVRNS